MDWLYNSCKSSSRTFRWRKPRRKWI